MPVTRVCSRPVLLLWALMLCALTSCLGGEAEPVAGNSSPMPTASKLAQPKAVVIVMIDALRPDDLGLYGSVRPTSPELDRLAADSLVFDQASASAPKTIPSVPQAFSSSLFPDIELGRTLMQVFSDQGWGRTAAIINNPYVGSWVTAMRPSFGDIQSGDLNAEAIVDAALAQIDGWVPQAEQAEQAQAEPWALFLHFLDTHTPYKVPQPWAGKFVSTSYAGPVALRFDDVAGAWSGRYGPPSQRQIRNLYAGTVAYTDHHLGRLVQGLKDRGLYEETAILITADHGEEFWEHGGFFHGQSLFDELLRVPLMLKLPGNVGAGRRSEAPVGLIDIVPTIAALLSAPQPDPNWLGVSLLGALTDEPSMARLIPAVVGRPDSGRPERHGLRGAGVKYVIDVVDGTEHLFDLKADPEERMDLAAVTPEKLAPLREAWRDFAHPLRENGFHLEIVGVADRDESWTATLRMQPEAQLVNTAREQLESGDVLITGHHNLNIIARGVVEAGQSDGFRFDVLGNSGTLYVEVRFGEEGAPMSVWTNGGEVDASLGFDLAGTGLVGRRQDLIAAGGAEPNPGAAPRVLLWRSTEAREPPHSQLSDGDRERLRSLGYLE